MFDFGRLVFGLMTQEEGNDDANWETRGDNG